MSEEKKFLKIYPNNNSVYKGFLDILCELIEKIEKYWNKYVKEYPLGCTEKLPEHLSILGREMRLEHDRLLTRSDQLYEVYKVMFNKTQRSVLEVILCMQYIANLPEFGIITFHKIRGELFGKIFPLLFGKNEVLGPVPSFDDLVEEKCMTIFLLLISMQNRIEFGKPKKGEIESFTDTFYYSLSGSVQFLEVSAIILRLLREAFFYKNTPVPFYSNILLLIMDYYPDEKTGFFKKIFRENYKYFSERFPEYGSESDNLSDLMNWILESRTFLNYVGLIIKSIDTR